MSDTKLTKKGSPTELLIESYPGVAYRSDGEYALSALTGLPPAEVEALLSDPEVAARAEAARVKAEVEGKTLAPLLHSTALKLVGIIHEGAADVDAHEAAELLRPISRIMSDLERSRIAEKEKDANASLPIFNFVFNNGGVQATQITDADLPVIDVTARMVEGGA